jgi:hypothetical protein
LPLRPRLNRLLLQLRIPTPKLESCAKCPLAHTVAYGNKTNTGNHLKRHPESNSVHRAIGSATSLVNW